MTRPIPAGIDLGTTNSAAAWVDESGQSQLARNAEDELLTPSIVLFDASEVVVGKEARSAATVRPDLVAEWVKRDMGAATYSRPIGEEYLPPEVIQACILRKLKADLAKALGPDFQAVITVPAYFDEPRRKATADAGEMAGLDVLDIVNEPTAAALAFAETLGFLSSASTSQEELTVLVFDLGGGTFDTTLLKLAPGNIETLATDGDVQLGGHDWDQRLVDYLAEAFMKAYEIDPRNDPAGLNRLYQTVVEAKHTLSARSHATARIDHKNLGSEIRITRDQFKELTADLLERTAFTTRQLITDAKIEFKDIDRVLLVGGSTRMPMVAEMLQQLTGLEPDRTVNPDEAVARGAALYAAHLLAKRDGQPSTVQISNVNAHSLGVEGIDQETLRKKNVVLIPRNTPLPAKATERFVTKSEGQRSIAVQILEGESSLPSGCTAIGRMVIGGLPDGLPKNWPIEVTFQYASNGRLSVRAVVPGTQKESLLEINRTTGLNDEKISKWKAPVSAGAGFDAFEAMVDDVLNERDSPDETPQNEPPSKQRASVSKDGPEAATAASSTSRPLRPLPIEDEVPQPEQPDLDPPSNTASSVRAGRSGRVVPRWLVLMIGLVTSGAAGLGLGYWILSQLRPEEYPLPW